MFDSTESNEIAVLSPMHIETHDLIEHTFDMLKNKVPDEVLESLERLQYTYDPLSEARVLHPNDTDRTENVARVYEE